MTKDGLLAKHGKYGPCRGSRQLPREKDLALAKQMAREDPRSHLYLVIKDLPEDEYEAVWAAKKALDDFCEQLDNALYLVHVMLPEYGSCRVCGGKLNAEQTKHAMHRHQQETCSPECRRKEIIKRHACCEKAEMIPCVCMYSFKCPEHGELHIGTHD